MTYIIRITIIILLTLLTQKAKCQTDTSIAAIATDYGKVMAFTKQPYLHYTTVTTMQSMPIFEAKDTATLRGEFFKCLDNFYSNNGLEEIYIQDSFLVSVNHERKSIWISKVDMASKNKMDLLSVTSMQMQALLIKNYASTQMVLNDSTSRLDFSAKEKNNSKAISTSLRLEYNSKIFLPTILEIKAKVRQPAEEEILAAINNENIDINKIYEVIDGVNFLVRTQEMHIVFNDINYAEAIAIKMPSWKTVLHYDTMQNEFIATLSYTGYEVTSTF